MMSVIEYKFKHLISALLYANIGQLKFPLSILTNLVIVCLTAPFLTSI